MANVLLINTKKEHELEPGKSIHLHWNHASPTNSVWSANAVPSSMGSTLAGFSQDTALEVTRLWRRLIVIEHAPPKSQISDTTVEEEIHYEVKNVGPQKARFVVFLSVVS